MSDNPTGLDLDARREAARREVTEVPHLTLNGNRVELPIELPLDVLDPLTKVNVDVSVLVRQVLDIRAAGREAGEQQTEELLGAFVDMLIVNPQLPTEVIDAVKEMARRLLGEDGYAELVKFRPTTAEVGAIAKYLFSAYGVGLGEASRSSDSSEISGTTSKEISPGEAATSGTRTARRRTRAS